MDRSIRRGGEKRARFDFSTRTDISGWNFGTCTSSLAGLRNNARLDVSRVAVGTMSAILLAAFFDEPGVFRAEARRPPTLNVRRFGVAGFTFFINFLEENKTMN